MKTATITYTGDRTLPTDAADRVVHVDAEGRRAGQFAHWTVTGGHLFWARAGAGSHTRAGFQDLQPWRVRRVAVDAFSAKARRTGLAA